MNFESLKIFGMQVSDAVFWLLETLVGPAADRSASGASDNPSTNDFGFGQEGGPVFLSRSDAIMHGGMGIETDSGTFL